MDAYFSKEDVQRINDEMIAGIPQRRPVSPLVREIMSKITRQDIERSLSEASRNVRTGHAPF